MEIELHQISFLDGCSSFIVWRRSMGDAVNIFLHLLVRDIVVHIGQISDLDPWYFQSQQGYETWDLPHRFM